LNHGALEPKLNYLIEAIGWLASAFALYTFWARTMIPLRLAAIAGCFFALIYNAHNHNVPSFVTNSILLPLNIWRLGQMRRLIKDARSASFTPGDFNWLKPFMNQVDFRAGEVIFSKGDVGDHAFLIGAGEVRIPEHDAIAKEGALLGEIGLLSKDNRRTASAVAATDVRAWRISYKDLEELCLQNPDFCFHLARIIVQRYEANIVK
jgi:hypothetical protein